MAKRAKTATTEQPTGNGKPRSSIGRGRTYGLGQRDPHTLPNYSMDNESGRENREKTRRWKSLGKQARHGHSFVGMKYV